MPKSNRLKVPDNPSSSGMGSDPYCELQSAGRTLNSNGKVATVLVLEEIEEIVETSDINLVDSEGNETAHVLLKALLDDHSRFVTVMFTEYDSVKDVCILSSDNSIYFFYLSISVVW